MNKLLYSFIIVVLIGCSSNTPNENAASTNKTYFNFDEITYVRILISDKEINELYAKENKSTTEQILFNILAGPLNKDISETTIVKDLDGVNKIEYPINKKYFEELNKTIFVEKKCSDFAPAVCDPFYRDILLFKKNGTLCGVAKFSFNGHICDFSGTSANYECFGAFGEFDKLRKILKENSLP